MDRQTLQELQDKELLNHSVSYYSAKGAFCKPDCYVCKLLADNEVLWERLIDLTVDVWGGACPDCCTQPVMAGYWYLAGIKRRFNEEKVMVTKVNKAMVAE